VKPVFKKKKNPGKTKTRL